AASERKLRQDSLNSGRVASQLQYLRGAERISEDRRLIQQAVVRHASSVPCAYRDWNAVEARGVVQGIQAGYGRHDVSVDVELHTRRLTTAIIRAHQKMRVAIGHRDRRVDENRVAGSCLDHHGKP